MIRKFFLCILCLMLLLPYFPTSSFADFTGDDKITVVLDPGHGGKDSGALGIKYESYYNLKVAQYCAEALKENGNFTVIMTRDSQSEELTLAERGVFADSVNADIIVSIHFNSSSSSVANGIEVYSSVLDRFDLSSLAKLTAKKLKENTGLSIRGCYRKYDEGDGVQKYYWSEKYQWDVPGDSTVGGLSDHYGIITWAAKFGFPGMIIEHAYLSNPGDSAVTDNEENLKKMGEADAAAIIEYYTNHTHTYSDSYTQDYPVSCFSAGKKSIHCTICHHRKNVTTVAAAPDPDAHLWIAEETVDPTCSTDGSADMYCRYTHNLIDKGCEQFEEHTLNKVIPKLGHEYVVTFSQELTHTQDGITEYTCDRCQGKYTDTQYAEGHTYVFVSHTDPTCTADGGDTYECEKCGEVYTEVAYATGHSNVEISRTEATCTKDGIIEFECSVCGETTEEAIKSTGHSYSQKTISEKSCVSNLRILFTCESCGDEYTEETATDGHDFTVISKTEATCDAEGVSVQECSVCNAKMTKTVPALGHDWGEKTVQSEPTLFGDGTIIYTCTRDSSHISTETISSKLASFLSEYKLIVIIIAVAVIITVATLLLVIFLIRCPSTHYAHDVAKDNNETSEPPSEEVEDKSEDTGDIETVKQEEDSSCEETAEEKIES